MNYDESDLKDDPGSVTGIVRRGRRHAETIIDSSKHSNDGVYFRQRGATTYHVVYKSKYLYPTRKTRYSASESRWFNVEIFEEWCIPYLRVFEGPKAVIGAT